MIVAGIDPSLTNTGIAILHDGQPTNHYRRGHPGRDGASDIDRMRRVGALLTDINKIIRAHTPDLIIIESPAYGQYLPSTCDRNVLWGSLVHRYSIDRTRPNRYYAGATPTCRAQFATGKGHAPKQAVIDAVNHWWPHLNLKPRQDNEADAYVLATMGAAHYEPELLPFKLTDWQRNNLEAIAWPVTA
ncbi:crossover junction endodeoxyribonuclease RuvC [Mycolicibacterium sp. XJ1819]